MKRHKSTALVSSSGRTRVGCIGLALCMALSVTMPVSAAAFSDREEQRQYTDWSLQDWLGRLHEASRRRAYAGTFVVSAGPEIAASKIWHICDGTQQLERIETLTGTSRITMRRNDEVLTLVPDERVALKEKREALRLFPDLLSRPGQAIDAFYSARVQGAERVAGHEAVVVDFVPRDAKRYGYRVWSEKKTGLVVKLQTLDGSSQVIEQVAFTELQLNAPVRMDKLAKQMEDTRGYQVLKLQLRKTTPEAEGWRLKAEVPGFKSMSCHSRAAPDTSQAASTQWVFSDGLASVSLFLEKYDAQRHLSESAGAVGATHTLTRRLGAYWVTAMGEVPPQTLRSFIDALERTR